MHNVIEDILDGKIGGEEGEQLNEARQQQRYKTQ